MEIRTAVLLATIGAALATLIPRVLPLALLSRIELPGGLVRWLGYVPVAALAALLAQEVMLDNGALALPPQNLAIIPTLLVAVRTHSLIGTVVTGVVAMALLRLFF